MALQLPSFEKDTGEVYASAYAKVIDFHLNYQFMVGQFVVAVWISKEARDNGKKPIFTEEFHLSFAQDLGEPFKTNFGADVLGQANINPQTQAYGFLKKLPKYRDGVDV